MNHSDPRKPLSHVRRASFSVMSSTGPSATICALLTSPSMCPNRSNAALTVASTSSRRRTSHCTASASTPRARTSSAVFSTLSRVRPAATMCAPSAAAANAMPCPMPCPAPVTSTTLPSSLPTWSPPGYLTGRQVIVRPVDLRYSPAELDFRDELRGWLATTLPPLTPNPAADDWPARRDYDTAWQRALHDAGYAGINWPKEYG